MSRDGCCPSLLRPGVPVPHRMERNTVAASAPAAYSPFERGFASKINGATLAKLILHCSPVSCGSSVWVQSSCLKAEIAADGARKGQD